MVLFQIKIEIVGSINCLLVNQEDTSVLSPAKNEKYQFMKWELIKWILRSEWTERQKHTSFRVVNAFTMRFAAEIMLDGV